MRKNKTQEEVIKGFIKIHGSKYDYSKVNYINCKTKVCIICPEHGEFWQTPNHHLGGRGCPKCKGVDFSNRKKYTKEIFVKESIEIHGNKYNYDDVEYCSCNKKVDIRCLIHGVFKQTPASHLQGRGCPECGKIKQAFKQKTPLENVINKFNAIHGNKYDYSLVNEKNYKNNQSKIPIICKVHGVFEQSVGKHLEGQGCPYCYGNIKKTTEQFIEEAKKVHGDKYDYSKVNYINTATKVCIICPEHGEFWQTPKLHLRGQGCPVCAKLKMGLGRYISFDEFVKKVNEIHKNRYQYINKNYKGASQIVTIICPEHGEFQQKGDVHLQGCGCPKCASLFSRSESEIYDFIKKNYNNEIIRNTRNILINKEIDIFIPDYNIAIEYNGIRWHSEQFNRGCNYHLNKTIECNKQGIKLIHIFEDEYLEHKEIVLSKIKHLLKKDTNLPKIQARKCIIKEIDKNSSKDFLVKNHIQGSVTATVYLGCFYNDELVAVMDFKEEKKGNNRWELNRFATDITKHCIGVGGKLFNYFIKNYNPSYIKSFADRRWTLDKENNLYTKLGFKLEKTLKPDYKYVNGNKREHKFGYRKQTLIKKYPDAGLTMDMTETEMTEKLGFYRIWDCGLFKFVWEKE